MLPVGLYGTRRVFSLSASNHSAIQRERAKHCCPVLPVWEQTQNEADLFMRNEKWWCMFSPLLLLISFQVQCHAIWTLWCKDYSVCPAGCVSWPSHTNTLLFGRLQKKMKGGIFTHWLHSDNVCVVKQKCVKSGFWCAAEIAGTWMENCNDKPFTLIYWARFVSWVAKISRENSF